jgi:hypothetical protein
LILADLDHGAFARQQQYADAGVDELYVKDDNQYEGLASRA